MLTFVSTVWRKNLARRVRLQIGELVSGLEFDLTGRVLLFDLTFSFLFFAALLMYLMKQRSWLAQASGTW